MKFSKQIKSLSYFKAHASKILDEIARTRDPMIITVNGEAKAVLQDIWSYEETQEEIKSPCASLKNRPPVRKRAKR